MIFQDVTEGNTHPWKIRAGFYARERYKDSIVLPYKMQAARQQRYP
jgi:hypothetical protein